MMLKHHALSGLVIETMMILMIQPKNKYKFIVSFCDILLLNITDNCGTIIIPKALLVKDMVSIGEKSLIS